MSTENKENYVADKLTYTKDKLELYLTKHDQYIHSDKSWQFWAGITLTLLVTVLSSSMDLMHFKHPFEFLFVLGLALSFFKFVHSLVTHIKKEDPIKKLKETLFENYINQPDRNALFIVKRVHSGEDQILVFKNKAWGDCYFLPYVRINRNSSTQECIRKQVGDLLDYHESEIEINQLLDKQEITEKFHPSERVVKEYHSSYFHLAATTSLKSRDISTLDTFKVSTKEFQWKALEELEADLSTQNKNRDVLDMLRDNKSDFITNSATFK
ncbi:hypothetical protein [Pseudoalteromonas shioyasakiensis]|uniref:hypothetical protein n=1 Tax=Pseudoalteromonas shioyasakiensis TaxID=1190813 RepID=UPI001C3C2F9A|nr:hypothetical protein [Pseudoalteromonas shioyasakiensis]